MIICPGCGTMDQMVLVLTRYYPVEDDWRVSGIFLREAEEEYIKCNQCQRKFVFEYEGTSRVRIGEEFD